MDAGIEGKLSKKWLFSWHAKDLISELRWGKQHYTTANASSDNITYDQQGFISTRPILSWFETEKTLNQNLPSQQNVRMSYELSDSSSMGLEYYQFDTLNFYRVFHNRKLGSGINLHSHFDWTTQSILVSCRYKHFLFSYEADNFFPDEAYTLGLKLGYALSF